MMITPAMLRGWNACWPNGRILQTADASKLVKLSPLDAMTRYGRARRTCRYDDSDGESMSPDEKKHGIPVAIQVAVLRIQRRRRAADAAAKYGHVHVVDRRVRLLRSVAGAQGPRAMVDACACGALRVVMAPVGDVDGVDARSGSWFMPSALRGPA